MIDRLKERAREVYATTARYHAPAAFVLGFAWDSATLTRIDALSDNLLLGAYLVALGLLIVLHHRLVHEPARWPRLARHEPRVEWVVQFLFGGLYSAYVVFYFKSAAFGRSLVFVAALFALMILNELVSPARLKEQLRVSQFGFVAFSFLLFFVPVVTGHLGWGAQALAALGAVGASLAVARGMAEGLVPDLRDELVGHGTRTAGLVLGLTLLNVLGVIPPVPLALTDGGIFHGVERGAEGFVLRYEPSPWRPWRDDDRVFRHRPGDRVWCFSAVFAPRGAALDVVHVWQRWDDGLRAWQTSDRIPFDVKGGREGGYRAYTRKRNVQEGRWRVVVEDEHGRVLGYFPFEVVPGEGEAALVERVVR